MKDAIILGGGISGLTAGYLLKETGRSISILEKASEPGGPILSVREDGFLVERGPNSLLLPDAWVERFIRQLGLGDQLLETSPAAQKRYIVKRGRPVPVPMTPLQAISTPLFSLRAKLGFLAEPFRSPLPDEQASSETVAQFTQRRMGKDFLQYAIDPFVSGVYAGDPTQLILEYAFPIMRGFERDGGSIIKGALQRKRRQKREGTSYQKRSVSFRDGLETLPLTLASKLENELQLATEARAIENVSGTWKISGVQNGEPFERRARNLLVCLPSHAIKKLVWPDQIATRLKATPDLPYPAVHSLSLGFRRDLITHPLDGFGVLVPSKEPQTILGALFSSSLYPDRAPKGHCLLTVMIGGVRHPELADAPENEQVALALRDLRPLLGLRGDPVFIRGSSWPQAIPQYTAAFGPWREALRLLQRENPTLRFGGSAIDGIAMGAAILSGKRLATQPED